MIVDKINTYLTSDPKSVDEIKLEAGRIAEVMFERQFMKEGGRGKYIGLSSCGRCARQSAYTLLGFEHKGKEKDARSKVVFYQGDLTEQMVYLLAKLAGCDIRHGGLNQMKVSLHIGDKEVNGHPDGILKTQNEGDFLVEIKSMSSYGFDDFQKGEIDSAYVAQINSYLDALGLTKCVMVALNKDAGVLAERIIDFDPEIVKKAKETLSAVLGATIDDLPKRWYEPGKEGILPWNCLYCSFWGHCWPTAEKVLVKRSYKLKVKGMKK